MFISEARKKFLDHCQSAVTLSEHTLRAYTGDLKDVEKYLGARPIAGIDRDDLRHYVRHLREQRHFKETSIKRRIACLKLLFKWAKQETLVETNPFDTLNERIRLPRRLPRALDSIDVEQLERGVILARQDNCDLICQKTAIRVLLETGIRVGELCSISLDDLSLPDRSIKIHGKGNRQRLVYLLSKRLSSAVENYMSRRATLATASTRLFLTSSGQPITPPQIRAALRRLARQANIKRHVTPHMLRHTCATRWLEAGLDIRYVQKLLGHHSISTTEIYTHVSDQSLRDALRRAMR